MRCVFCAIILAVLLNIFLTVESSQCPKGWTQTTCSCFLVNDSKQGLTSDRAMKTCSTKHSAKLANLQNFANKQALQLRGSDAWIGLRNDTKKPGCVALRATNIWKASDCNKTHRFICKNSTISGRCPIDWLSFNNSCYWISHEKLNYTNAQAHCSNKRAYIPKRFTKPEYEFVRKQNFDSGYVQAWFGLQRVVNTTEYNTALGVWLVPEKLKTTHTRSSCLTMILAKENAISVNQTCNQLLHAFVCQAEVRREYTISVPEVNETSARLLLTMEPNKCGVPKNGKHKLVIRNGKDVIHSRSISSGNETIQLSKLKPNTPYEVNITGNNLVPYVKSFRTIEIRNPLRVLTNISSITVHAEIGTTVNLLCAASGEHPITFTWKKGERELRDYVKIHTPHSGSILSVKVTDKASYGEYTCHVKDRFNETTRSIQVSDLPRDSKTSDDERVIAIVLLAIVLAILAIVIAFLCRYVHDLKRKLRQTRQDKSVNLKNVSTNKIYDHPQEKSPTKNANVYDGLSIQVDDENASYTALQRDPNEVEEENLYANYAKEAPLYVNATEFSA